MIFLFYFLLLLLVLAGAYFLLGAYRLLVRREILFVPTSNAMLPALAEGMGIRPGDAVYDLGCGNGRILIALAEREKGARYVGIERDIIPYILFKLKLRGKKLPIEARRADFFGENISEATHVVMYLIPSMMPRVVEKLSREARPGTRIFSVDFPLPASWRIRTLPPIETGHYGRKIHLYLAE